MTIQEQRAERNRVAKQLYEKFIVRRDYLFAVGMSWDNAIDHALLQVRQESDRQVNS